jgi:hypothetical protein
MRASFEAFIAKSANRRHHPAWWRARLHPCAGMHMSLHMALRHARNDGRFPRWRTDAAVGGYDSPDGVTRM